MRRSLGWVLTATLALTAVALWPRSTPTLVAAIEPSLREHAQALDAVMNARQGGDPTQATPLPTRLPRLALEPARRDIFAAEGPPPGPQAPPVPQPLPVIAAPPPAPQAPPLSLRFLGRMVTPDGQPVLYLARGEAAVAVAVGDRLDEGYVVESLADEGVTLIYPPLGSRVTVPIPAAPGP